MSSMETNTTTMQLYPITEGAVLLESTGGGALFGSPPEILKEILRQKLPIPNTVVLPAILYKGQCSQVAMEFLFF